jgi:hypothetical protein
MPVPPEAKQIVRREGGRNLAVCPPTIQQQSALIDEHWRGRELDEIAIELAGLVEKVEFR